LAKQPAADQALQPDEKNLELNQPNLPTQDVVHPEQLAQKSLTPQFPLQTGETSNTLFFDALKLNKDNFSE
jgi:hypothetical protein